MPVLTIPNTFVPFTKILSADVNSNFTAIKTLLNTTKLDDDNIQNAGITRSTKLKTGTANAVVINAITTGAMSELAPGSAGYFLQTTGSSTAPIWAPNPLSAQYNYILGSAAQVTSGAATNSTFASITQADGDRILILPGYVTSENWSVTKKVLIAGLGNLSRITGTVTFTNTADNSIMLNCRVSDTITLNSGADGIIVDDIFLASGKSFTDNGDGNYLTAVQET